MNTADHAFLFPGQGAQTLGMGVDLVEAHPRAREVYDRAREIVGADLLAICRDGPEEVLNSTRISQPAIFLHSLAVLEVLRHERNDGQQIEARGTAGLSLGEYSSLVFAESLRFEDALEIVVRRGEYMQEACDETKGGMASVLGLPAATVQEILDKLVDDLSDDPSRNARIGISNYNSPGQTVISGEADVVAAAAEPLKAAGAKRVIPLRVAGAYHSELMASATTRLSPLVEKLEIRAPRLPFYSNVTGRQVSDPEEIRSGLVRQVESSVRWEDIMNALVENGIRGAYELGPGRVLKGLMKSVAREIPVIPLGTVESLRDEQILSS